MDWKVFGTTFITIFLAEFGDKTQFAAMAASAGTKSTLSVLLAVILGLGLAGTLGVAGGRVLGEFIKPEITKTIAGVLFIAVGVWTLFSKG